MKHLKNVDVGTSWLTTVMSQCTTSLPPTMATCVNTASPNEMFGYICWQGNMLAQYHQHRLGAILAVLTFCANVMSWYYLTHWDILMHVCINKLGHHWFRWWLVALLAPIHYQNQFWHMFNWTLRNKLQWNYQNSYFFIQENAFQNVVCKSGGHFVSASILVGRGPGTI